MSTRLAARKTFEAARHQSMNELEMESGVYKRGFSFFQDTTAGDS
jgi:hypothetical protein